MPDAGGRIPDLGPGRHPGSDIRHLVERGCRTISRFLYPGGWQSFLWAGHCWPALATYPEVERDGPSLLPYLVLLRVGFTLPAELLLPRCALTAPFHPYPIVVTIGRCVFCGTFRIRNRIPAVSRHAALWRPDFPPPGPGGTRERLPVRQPHMMIVSVLHRKVYPEALRKPPFGSCR